MTRIVRMGDIRTSPLARSLRQDAMTTVFVSEKRPARGCGRWFERIARRTRRPVLAASILGAACTGLFGCETPERKLQPAAPLVAPYAANLVVAPFGNDSGVVIRPDQQASVSDKLVASLNGVEGWQAVPLNRTLEAMRQVGLAEIRTLDEARSILRLVGGDGIVVGTITEWNPYDPPRFGANILLVADEAEVQKAFESRRLVGGTGTAGSNPDAPVRTLTDVVALFDATNHTVRGQVREYAKSNDDITDGFDPPERYYLMVYDHWLDFAASELVSTLVDRERLRVNTAQAAASSTD